MLFNSTVFIALFLPITLAGFFLLARWNRELPALWLAVASLVFYGCWDVRYVPLLLGSVVFNYAAGYLIGHARAAAAGRWLIFAVTANLALLGYYKYTGFFLVNAAHFLGRPVGMVSIVLPLGISFFTFTQIAFLVDTRRRQAHEYNFVHYLVFVTYFPHLIAGPILHHRQMMPQFAEASTYRWNWENAAQGLTVFIIGLLKKVWMADTLSQIATPIFQVAHVGGPLQLCEAWLGALAYTLQLYFDFSGYTDMAIGLSLLFNIQLPLNFNSPYRAVNIIDFWRRWHMTLSAFLRDYLYISLGGNRKGRVRRYLNLMVTMLLGGLWHGAGWTFVIWGGLHGFYLCINHAFLALRRKLGLESGAVARWIDAFAPALTFLAVVVAWVVFRAANFIAAGRMLYAMAGGNGVSFFHAGMRLPPAIIAICARHGVIFNGIAPLTAAKGLSAVLLLALGLFIVWFLPNTQHWVGLVPPGETSERIHLWQPRLALTCIAMGVLFGLALTTVTSGRPSEFLYFQF
jgi:D-alanyl-lipoteichoic acid acyltransferase DltB (MBOAT superfamily)